MGDVELDRPTAAGLEVDDKQPSPCPQQVAQMRLAVQELLGGSGGPDRAAHAAQGVAEEFPVGVKKFGGPRAVSNQSPRFGDSIERHKG